MPGVSALFQEELSAISMKGAVRCRLCAHYCILRAGEIGKCSVRQNIKGSLFALNWGRVTGTALDPIEKKPLYHYKPGSKVLSLGTPGCNFSCLNCQNWTLSQSPATSVETLYKTRILSPEIILNDMISSSADGIAFTYSEPTIFFEYALDIMKLFRKTEPVKNCFSVFVTNGFFTPELLDYILEHELIQAMNIDLKFMSEKQYSNICGGHLKPVLNNILKIANSGIHLEITNLLIPGENDSDRDIKQLSDFIVGISPDIPLHFSRFHPDYKMETYKATPVERLENAYRIANDSGIHHIYLGNLQLPQYGHTFCVKCGAILVERYGYKVVKINIIDKESPKCLYCNTNLKLIL
jgi:pyruvate formate lyase activating enzyme